MDGQGEISNKHIETVLSLTNIVFIHFFEKDSLDKTSLDQLSEVLNLIHNNDDKIQICLLIRDTKETKELTKSEYPLWLPN